MDCSALELWSVGVAPTTQDRTTCQLHLENYRHRLACDEHALDARDRRYHLRRDAERVIAGNECAGGRQAELPARRSRTGAVLRLQFRELVGIQDFSRRPLQCMRLRWSHVCFFFSCIRGRARMPSDRELYRPAGARRRRVQVEKMACRETFDFIEYCFLEGAERQTLSRFGQGSKSGDSHTWRSGRAGRSARRCPSSTDRLPR